MWAAFGAIWELNEKVSFNGAMREIRINSDATEIDVRADLYSAWKRWVQLDDNAKYLPAFRTIGGDSVGGGQFAGDMYFLMNGWQVAVDHQVSVSGVLYHDDALQPFVVEAGGGVTSVVSNLAQTVAVTQNVVTGDVSSIPAAVWASVIEGMPADQILKIMLAALAGRSSGVGTATEQYFGQDGITPRIVATFDESNNRASVALNGS